MSTQPTAGPWRYERGHWWPQSYHGFIRTEDGRYVAEINTPKHDDEAAATLEANARLIAASPQLAEALEAILQGAGGNAGRCLDCGTTASIARVALEKINAAS